MTPLNLDYHVGVGDHRPITLVFATERTPEAIRQALFARQTAVYTGNRLIGDERFLRPIFTGSLQFKNPKITLKGKQRVLVQIHNQSDLDFRLEREGELAEVTFPKKLVLAARKTVLLEVTGKATNLTSRAKLALPYQVTNLLIGPDQPLSVTLELEVSFLPTTTKPAATKPRTVTNPKKAQ